MKESLYKYLNGNEYPGRGICIGKSKSGKLALVAYFIMGRSVNSRNRVFDAIDGGIRTLAADPARMTDPHLIIYNPVLTLDNTTIVTNGDQTNTIRDFIASIAYPGFGFEAALNTRTFEDDAPNWTPRISGVVDMKLGGYKLSIIKSVHGNEKSVQRLIFDYPQPLPGEGHFISTYQGDGAPLPSFTGEPLSVAMDVEEPEKFAARIWKALNKDNKVSLFVRAIQLANQTCQDIIINKYKIVEE